MGSFVKFRYLDSLKWPKNGPKPTIFLDDVIDYLGRFTLLNQAKKMGLEKCYSEMVWFNGFRFLDHEIFKFKNKRFLLRQHILQQKSNFKLKYLTIYNPGQNILELSFGVVFLSEAFCDLRLKVQ